MGNRTLGYWICLLIALAALFAGLMMRSSPNHQTRELAQYLGIGAIALILVGRFVFRRPAPPTPPMPKD